MEKHIDVVVVGAGLQGLVAAKTYLACEPNAKLLILDSNTSYDLQNKWVLAGDCRCRKLIVATGISSIPSVIDISGSKNFSCPILPFASLGRSASNFLSIPFINNVAVTGGSKSAFDAVYMMATAGPFKTWLESLPDLRPLTWCSPCLWRDADGFGWIRSWLHDTRWGRASVDALWWAIGATLIRQTGLNTSDELIVLKPDESVFWYGAGLGALNYPSNFHDFIRDGTVRVRRNDTNHLKKDTIVFEDGERLETDALICVTGWEWRGSIHFLSPETHAELGVPSAKYTPSQQEKWDALDFRADREILHRFPRLATRPTKDFNREDLLVARPGVGT
ncbi:hypothetical protein OEA41_007706 [Lepraria neglecta]|uniref:FAD/NAD(P)-binding domain-containing protein n=1 Tax=Lepraria neglecta TaxID=209136 RepID=A0AAE0DN68_9LECA|nr:hypothetical protein OEA41_007706 [Lepraria neglecta]